jgi:DNA-binding transcriptional regulator LsrR (DeoR family)
MSHEYPDEQVRFVAKLYYIDHVSQPGVARLAGVSQAKVSRLLAEARKRGIVRITVEDYEPRNRRLEQVLRGQFGLENVIVAKTAGHATGDVARATVGIIGAPLVSGLLPSSGTIAIAGGRTVRELADRLPARDGRQLVVVQAMGGIDSSISEVDAMELGRSLVRRWGGRFLTLTTPAFVPNRAARDSFLGFPQIQAVWRRLDQADAALVGIGAMGDSAFVERGVLDTRDLDGLRQSGALGEICGRFFDRDGRECDTPWKTRVIGMDLAMLRKTPRVIAIAVGADKAQAVAAAARGGLIKTLLIDEPGAEGRAPRDQPLHVQPGMLA